MNGHDTRTRLAHFRLGLILISITLTFACPPTTARAQDLDEVTFAGVVADERGAVVPGASVTARLVSTGAERAARSERQVTPTEP